MAVRLPDWALLPVQLLPSGWKIIPEEGSIAVTVDAWFKVCHVSKPMPGFIPSMATPRSVPGFRFSRQELTFSQKCGNRD